MQSSREEESSDISKLKRNVTKESVYLYTTTVSDVTG